MTTIRIDAKITVKIPGKVFTAKGWDNVDIPVNDIEAEKSEALKAAQYKKIGKGSQYIIKASPRLIAYLADELFETSLTLGGYVLYRDDCKAYNAFAKKLVKLLASYGWDFDKVKREINNMQQNEIIQDVFVTTPEDELFEFANDYRGFGPLPYNDNNYALVIWQRGNPLPVWDEPTNYYLSAELLTRNKGGFYLPHEIGSFGAFVDGTTDTTLTDALNNIIAQLKRYFNPGDEARGSVRYWEPQLAAWASSGFALRLRVEEQRPYPGSGKQYTLPNGNIGILTHVTRSKLTFMDFDASQEAGEIVSLDFARRPLPSRHQGPLYTTCIKHTEERVWADNGACSLCAYEAFAQWLHGLPCGQDDAALEDWYEYKASRASHWEAQAKASLHLLDYWGPDFAREIEAIGLLREDEPDAAFCIDAPVYVNEEPAVFYGSIIPSFDGFVTSEEFAAKGYKLYRQGQSFTTGKGEAWVELCKRGYQVFYFVDDEAITEPRPNFITWDELWGIDEFDDTDEED